MPDAADASPFVRHRYLLLLLVGLLLYVPFLGARDMWYPDEPDIAEVGKAMYESGDWVAPRRVGEIWVDYPPMIYWTATIAAHAFGGYSDFAFRLPTALAAVMLVLGTCAAGSRWFGPREGLWAGFMLLTFQQFAYNAVSFRPDVLFAAALGAGLFVYAAGAGGMPRLALRLAGFALFGVAMLSKGPLGLLLPGLVLTLWHGRRREWRRILELAPLSLVALAIYLPWFVACARAMGADNILYELYAQNFARFLSGSRGHGQPVWYYLVNIWADLAPWSFLLPFAAAWLWRSESRRDRYVQLAAWWFGVFLVFLSLAATKRQLYLLPAYPAAALLIAPWIAKLGRRDAPSARPARIYSIALAALLGLLGLLALASVALRGLIVSRIGDNALLRETLPALLAPLTAIGVLLLASALWIGLAWRRDNVRAALVRIGAAHVALYLMLVAWLLPAMNPLRSFRPQGEWIRATIGSETRIGLLDPERGHKKMGAFALYSGALVQVMHREDEIAPFFERHPGSVVVVQRDAVGKVIDLDAERWRGRVLREMQAGTDHYVVIGGPVDPLPRSADLPHARG